MASSDSQSTADQLYTLLADSYSAQRAHALALDAVEQIHAKDLLAAKAEQKIAYNNAQTERAKSDQIAESHYGAANEAAEKHLNERLAKAKGQKQAIVIAVQQTHDRSRPGYWLEEIPSIEGKIFNQLPSEALRNLKAQADRQVREITQLSMDLVLVREQHKHRIIGLSVGIGTLILITLIISAVLINSIQRTNSNATTTQITENKQWTTRTQSFNGVPMVLAPSGCFMLGSDATKDVHALPNEQPLTRICFLLPFWIDQFPVWQAQFKQFKGQATHASVFTGDKRPVESITWFEARTYCEQQRGARLPTEAEYEYAARGPDNLIYPWGNTFVAVNVVYSKNSNQTADVGAGIRDSGASWVGAVDLSGNIWEWTNSIYKPYPYVISEATADNIINGSYVVLRGGSFFDIDTNVRSAVRFIDYAINEYGSFGFRCVHSY